MADLVSGKFKNEIGKFLVFDARYPYEYHGGHIRDAVNVYDKESLFAKLFDEPLTTGVGHERKPVVLIFHCEFSSERGPRLYVLNFLLICSRLVDVQLGNFVVVKRMREIREKDRLLNEDKYPHLYYPEMYLLEGGYKDFFQNHDVIIQQQYLSFSNLHKYLLKLTQQHFAMCCSLAVAVRSEKLPANAARQPPRRPQVLPQEVQNVGGKQPRRQIETIHIYTRLFPHDTRKKKENTTTFFVGITILVLFIVK